MWALAALALLLAGSPARADKVHLFGGSVVEGKVTKQGDKVLVEVESGQVTLPADSVERIESSTSDVQRFEQSYAKLRPGDVAGMMALADFCRDHDMRDQEHRMLVKVIEVAPDHKEARARLGYVRTDTGWITREEQYQAQGMVQYEGRWVTRQEMAEIERQREASARQRDAAASAAEIQHAQAMQASADAEVAEARERAAIQALPPPPITYPLYTTYSPWPYGYGYDYGYGYGYGYGRSRYASGYGFAGSLPYRDHALRASPVPFAEAPRTLPAPAAPPRPVSRVGASARMPRRSP